MNLNRISSLAFVIVIGVFAGCAQMPSGDDTIGLHNAIVGDQVGYVKAAVESGTVNVNQRIPAPAYAEGTPLVTIAARAGAIEVLRYLISAGADVNARTPANETPLMLATYFYGSDRDGAGGENFDKVVHALVESGAQLENDPGSYTPLAYAAYQGHEQMVQYLLARGARVDSDAQNGVAHVNTPLMMAAMQGHRKTVLLLLRSGADARVRVENGHTAAELAEKHLGRDLIGYLKCAERLPRGEKFATRCEGSSASASMLQPVSFSQ